MSRPKCGVAYEPICHSVEGCEKCDALMYFDGGGIKECIADTTDYFTRAEKIAALLTALKELGDMKTIVAWIRELRDQKKIFIFDGSGRFDPKHIIVADDYPRPDDEGAI